MLIIHTKEEAKKLPESNRVVSWKCGLCGKEKIEELRNIKRRTWFCSCLKAEEQFADIERRLNLQGFTFCRDLADQYSTSATGCVHTDKTTLPIQCLSCGNIMNSRLHNILTGRKKCDCDPLKVYSNDCDMEEYFQKWTPYNQQHFKPVSTKYEGRAALYEIECRDCGHVDSRRGITLQGTDIKCRGCQLGSIGERKVADYLKSHDIPYIQEYRVSIDGKRRRYDFYLPEDGVVIEFNGIQHYEAIDYFGGEPRFKAQQERDKEKEEYCISNNKRLVVIRYDEDIDEVLKHNLRFNDQIEIS